VFFRFHLPQDLAELAVDIDHESGALDAHPSAAILPYVVCSADFLVGVSKERHIQIELRDELLMRSKIVRADAEDDGIQLFKFALQITEAVCFLCSAGCVVFGIEKDHDILAVEIAETGSSSVRRFKIEIRGRRTQPQAFVRHPFGRSQNACFPILYRRHHVKSRGVIAAAESLLAERRDLDTVLNSVLSHLTALLMKRGFITI